MLEALDDVRVRRDRRRVELRPARRPAASSGASEAASNSAQRVSRLEGLEPPEADVAQDHLGRAALVQDLARRRANHSGRCSSSQRAPQLLADLLVGLGEKQDVRLRHDAPPLQAAHRQGLREPERLHVVGAAAVEVTRA